MARRISRTGGHRTTFNVEKPKKDKSTLDLETISRKHLKKLYNEHRVHDLMEMLGMSPNDYLGTRALYAKLDEYSIKRKSVPSKKRCSVVNKYSREEFEEMYRVAGSLSEMARRLGVSITAVKTAMNTHNIPYLSRPPGRKAEQRKREKEKSERLVAAHDRATSKQEHEEEKPWRNTYRNWDLESYSDFLLVYEGLSHENREALRRFLGYKTKNSFAVVASAARKALREADGDGDWGDDPDDYQENGDALDINEMTKEELAEAYFANNTKELMELFGLDNYGQLYSKLDEFGIPRKVIKRKGYIHVMPKAATPRQHAPVKENMVLVPVGDGTFRLEAR